jgi:hypothetical protein
MARRRGMKVNMIATGFKITQEWLSKVACAGDRQTR